MLNKILERVIDINSYRDELCKLAEAGHDYRVLDKFHYMVNDKLKIESRFYSLLESDLANHVRYCACCGAYMHHYNMYREAWYLQIDKEDILLYYTPWEEDDYEDEYCIDCYHLSNRESIYFCKNYELMDYIILIHGLNKRDIKCCEDTERPNDSVVLLDKNRNLITIDTSLEEFLKSCDCPIYYISIEYWADNYDDSYIYYEGLKERFNFEEFLNRFNDSKLISLEELFINSLEHFEDYDIESWHVDSYETLIMNKVNLYGNKDYEIGRYDLFKHQPRLDEFNKKDI